MEKALTDKQANILNYIRSRIEGGLPPTTPEIGIEFGITPPTAWHHLRALERKDRIRIHPHRARGIELADPPVRGRAVPILGRVAAGGPFLAEENSEGTLWLDGRGVRARSLFALRVYGDSMTGAGILDGDYVVAQSQSEASHNDIVVALIEQEATVKRLWRRGRKWYLRPENRRYRSIAMSGEDVQIQGKVLSIHRTRL